MDAGSGVELANLSTGGVWPLGYDVWPPSTLLMEDVDSTHVYESGGVADGQFVVPAGVDVDEEGSGDDRGAFCRSTDSSHDVLGDMEEEARCGEGVHDVDGGSELPESENSRGSDPVDVEGGKDMEPDVARRGGLEPMSHSPIPVSLGGDQAITACIKEEPLEQPLDTGNHVQRLRSWAVDFWQSERFNTISKQIKEDSKDEERPVVDVVGRPAEVQKNGGSRAVKVKAEEQKQVFGSDQLLMMQASEEPAHNLSASSDDSSDRLAGGVRSPATLSLVSRSLDAQPGCSSLVVLSYKELDKVMTEQVDECLEKDVRALLLPLEAKCSKLQAALRQNRWQTIQLSEQLSELILKEHWEGQAQKLSTDVTHPSERGARVLAPVSKFRTSRQKRCRWYPGTSWRRQLRKSRARRLWDSFYAKCASVEMTEHEHGEPDTDGSAEDSYQHDHSEVRGAEVAEFQQTCTGVRRQAAAKCQSKQTFEVSRHRHGRDAPKEQLPNQTPCEVEVRPGIPYTPESFWDAPYSIWMD
ncbi:uncharacterized protein LOC119399783 [Rhipicephalus sanguineus]|uniref:uncharacterized protein LOC119399783 n=1 Tax=Rhipicephalus sanguineus TaxID=34632 RepID=UPI0018948074|nr:uncharacterized protein LOC119399783 [Rhipicephalus sanguineus]